MPLRLFQSYADRCRASILQVYAITVKPRSSSICIDEAGSCIDAMVGGVLTDGMGAGGHGASVTSQDRAAVLAPPGRAAQLTLLSLWLAERHSLTITVDGGTPVRVTLEGSTLPTLKDRVFRSVPGGRIDVRSVAMDDGQPSLFSLAVDSVQPK